MSHKMQKFYSLSLSNKIDINTFTKTLYYIGNTGTIGVPGPDGPKGSTGPTGPRG